jgi:uncharacterized protein (TIGR02145 family)
MMNLYSISRYLLITLAFSGCNNFIPKVIQNSPEVISDFDCDGTKLQGNVIVNQDIINASIVVPFSGGSGSEVAQTVYSSYGIEGVTATLINGTVRDGTGRLYFELSGYARDTGVAVFRFGISDKTCNVNIPVTSVNKIPPDSTSAIINSSGGFIELKGVANLSIPAHLFSEPTNIQIKKSESEWFKEDFDLVSAMYGARNSLPYFVNIVCENYPEGDNMVVSFDLPDSLKVYGSSKLRPVLFGMLRQESDNGEILSTFEEIQCEFDSLRQVISAEIPAFYFGNNEQLKTRYHTVLQLASVEKVAGSDISDLCLKCPLKGCYVTSSYNPNRLHPVLKIIRPHRGVDFAASVGTPVYSAFDGQLLRKGTQKDNSGNPTGWGNYMIIKHVFSGVLFFTLYAHLSEFSLTVGQKVKKGTEIGRSGDSGTSSGPHLHMELIVPALIARGTTTRIDPMKYLCSSGCGANISPTDWIELMCHNLGGISSDTMPQTPDWSINGGYWQWGRKKMAAPAPNAGSPNSKTISGWNTDAETTGYWSDKPKSIQDPCPSGFRVPEKKEWEGMLANNLISRVGSWSDNISNYSTGILIGEKLFLPAAGRRHYKNGILEKRGDSGYYWCNDDVKNSSVSYLFFNDHDHYLTETARSYGFSVRCIRE